MKKIALVYIIIMVLLAGNIIAQPPFAETIDTVEGLEILSMPIAHHKQDDKLTFRFFVYNYSNGANMLQYSQCRIGLFFENGTKIFNNSNVAKPTDSQFVQTIGKDNFSFYDKSLYTFVYCNSSGLGGIQSRNIYVTSNGKEQGTSNSGLTIAVALILITLTILLFSMVYFIPYFDLKLVAGLMAYLIMVIDLYFAYVFVLIVDSTKHYLIENILTLYNIALIGFKFAIGIIVPILVLRTIIYLNNLNKQRKDKDEEWGMG